MELIQIGAIFSMVVGAIILAIWGYKKYQEYKQQKEQKNFIILGTMLLLWLFPGAALFIIGGVVLLVTFLIMH